MSNIASSILKVCSIPLILGLITSAFLVVVVGYVLNV
jgi:hypothetical protein